MKRKKYKKRKIFFVPNFTLPRRKVSYAKTLRRGSFIRLLSYFWTRRKDFTYKSVRRGILESSDRDSQPCLTNFESPRADFQTEHRGSLKSNNRMHVWQHCDLRHISATERLRIHQVGVYEAVDVLNQFDGSRRTTAQFFCCIRRVNHFHIHIDSIAETSVPAMFLCYIK